MHPADTSPVYTFRSGQPHDRKPRSDSQQLSAHANVVLLIDQDSLHAQRMIEGLTTRKLGVEFCVSVEQAAKRLRRIDAEYELIIVNVSDPSQPWIRFLRALREASNQSGVAVGPLFLCVSTSVYSALFELQIEQSGGRLVYER